MSGDVQPRKRKDKKRKKEDAIEDASHPLAPPVVVPTDDLNIHVHKEISTGGGICAKFVFFILLAILAVLIGLIITEHRGLTDLDAVNTESRFSQIFDGWTDESSLHDDHDEPAHSNEVGSHEEEEDEEEADHSKHEERDDHEDHDDHDEEEEEQEDRSVVSEDEETPETDEADETVERTEEEEDEDASDDNDYATNEDTYEETAEDQTLEDNDEEPEEEDSTRSVDEDTVERTYEQDSEEAPYNYEDEDREETREDEDPEETLEDEDREGTREDYDEEEQTVEDYRAGDDSKEDTLPASEEDEQVDDGEDSLKQASEEKKTEYAEDAENEQTELPNNSGVVKIGVGVSLLVVAYVVLVRKWRTDKGNDASVGESAGTEEIVPDLSRRNTIVVPPSLAEVEQELESGEDYSEEEDDEDIESEEDERNFGHSAKRQYQELRNVYTRTLTPDEEYDQNVVEDEGDEEREEVEYEHDIDADEEEEEDEEDIDEVDDEEEVDDKELLKRLEAKYGKIRNSDEEEEEENDENKENEDDEDEYDDYEKLKMWPRTGTGNDDSELNKKSGAQSYHSENITSPDDWPIREDLDNAENQIPRSPADALSLFNQILKKHPHSPRALYGKAKCLDILAENKRSNNMLQESIDHYLKITTSPNVPDYLFKIAAERCIDRLRFFGQYGRAIFVHKLLIEKFPNAPEFQNQLAVTYLTINKVEEARRLLKDVLSKWPDDGFALVHFGFILKTNDNNFQDAVHNLEKGISTKAPGVIDGRFYFHLGDALTRLGRKAEAYEWYENGVLNKVFLSKYQRSLYNVNRLKGKPWWNENDLPQLYQRFLKTLKEHWKDIREEGLAALNRNNMFKNEAENLRDVGDWKQFELYARGMKYAQNCQKCPKTCKIMDAFTDASHCRRGQIKFSVMEPGTHVWPHCGPTNCRLRLHLGLKIPPKTYIRVAEETRTWKEGEIFIFDDSFEHEVWHNGSNYRLVLIVDIWHPELTANEKATLSAI